MKNLAERRAPAVPAALVVRPAELPGLLDRVEQGLEVLSLDCFDTLLWRRTAAPTDVFFSLARSEPFARLGLHAALRAKAEARARGLATVRTGSTEVGLPEIYRAAFPSLDDSAVAELSRAELAAEKAACYGFLPTIELVRKAKAAGLRVVIASDTYFNEAELGELLDSVLPGDVVAAVERIFCSSVAGRSKSAGLLRHVLESLRVRPHRVLHVGDNPRADAIAARQAGMQAAHLLIATPREQEVARLTRVARAALSPDVRSQAPLESPLHAPLSLDTEPESPERLLGFHGLGPLLYAFGRFVNDAVRELERQGRRPRVLFLMRDAYLPSRASEALAGRALGERVAVSRFAAYAASFRSLVDIDDYLARSAGSARFEAMTRQLLLPPALAQEILRRTEASPRKIPAFIAEVRRPHVVEAIVAHSRAYAERFYRYLDGAVGLDAADTLVFVDLGYEGTAQQRLAPVLKAERGLDVVGRYLISARVPGWEATRRGLVDPSVCDDRTIGLLTRYVALLEDLCTSDGQSVVDYSESGEPLGAPKLIAEAQLERVRAVQAHCLAFVETARSFFAKSGFEPGIDALRGSSIGVLGRLEFFLTQPEIEYLEGFELDMNLATDDAFALFDRAAGLTSLRRRGLFFMEHGAEASRMNYPIELRAAGVELGLALLAQERFGLELTQSDLTLRHEPISVLISRGPESTSAALGARATHDGYFALEVPVGAGDLDVAVLFGKSYAWVQIESAELIPNDALYQESETRRSEDLSAACSTDGLVHRDAGLYECATPSAFLLVSPRSTKPEDGPFTCRIVFRPVAARPKRG